MDSNATESAAPKLSPEERRARQEQRRLKMQRPAGAGPGKAMVPGAAHARRSVLDALPKNAVGLEIGVHLGDFAAQILKVARPRMLHLIDPWQRMEDVGVEKCLYGTAVTQEEMDKRYEGVVSRFGSQIAAGKVKVHRATSQQVVSEFEDASLDFIYVDADHRFEGCVADLRDYAPKLRPGGILCGDDYGFGWWGDGVIRAVHTFLAERRNFRILFIAGRQFCLQRLPLEQGLG